MCGTAYIHMQKSITFHCHGNTMDMYHGFTFTFMHLADAFIQSDLTYLRFRLYSVCQYVCSLGIEPMTYAPLTQCSTTEPQEHSISS